MGNQNTFSSELSPEAQTLAENYVSLFCSPEGTVDEKEFFQVMSKMRESLSMHHAQLYTYAKSRIPQGSTFLIRESGVGYRFSNSFAILLGMITEFLLKIGFANSDTPSL